MKRILLMLGVLAAGARAEEELPRETAERYVVRLEFDNDLYFNSDSGFTAGWGLSAHSPAHEKWSAMAAPSAWIGRVIPGLESAAGDGYFVKRSYGISQQMQTPADLADPNLQVDDVPYAAALGFNASWYRLNNERANAFQVYLGVLGPAALGQEVQEFIHNDLGMGDPPMGWDQQLPNELLLNLNYEINEKLITWGELDPGAFGSEYSFRGAIHCAF